MFKEKRGLSDVVTVSLIILLAIAAVVIVWSFVKPTIEGTGKQIQGASACVNIEVKTISCKIADGSVVVENAGGDKKIEGVKIVYYASDATNSESDSRDTGCADPSNPISPLGRRTCGPLNGDIPKFGGNNPVRASVAPIVEGKTCPASTVSAPCA